MDHPIPQGPDELTDEWLTSALREAGAIVRARVAGHSWEPVAMQGAASIVARVNLDYVAPEQGAPGSLVAKFATGHGPMRAMMHGLGAYMRELKFYRNFGTDPGISTPHCFRAEIDPDSGIFVLLLEDMSDSRGGDQATFSVEDAEVAVHHLALFHAKWWGHPRLRELEFLRYPGNPADEAFMAFARAGLAAALPPVRERFGSDFPASLDEMTKSVLANWDALMARRRQAVDFVTLVHGDYHPQQLFFPSERGGRFAAFDWQTVNAASGGDDLARIIALGLSAEQRAASDARLIELYHSLLVAHGVAGYDLYQCREDFKLGLLTSVLINVLAAASIDPALFEQLEALQGVTPTEALFSRLADAVEAHDALAAVPA